LNKTIPFTIMITKAYGAALWLLAGNIMTVTEMEVINGVVAKRLMITNGALTGTFWALGAAIVGAFAGLYYGYQIGKKMADIVGPLIPIVLGLGLAFYSMWVAATMGASAVSTLKALGLGLGIFGGIGLAIGGMAAATRPATSQDYPEIDAYMAQMEAPTYGGGGTKGTSENLYVRKLVYTDSNQAEYMTTQTSTQAGA